MTADAHPRALSGLQVVPVTLIEANAYIEATHRHNGSLPAARFATAVIDAGGVVHGVAIAGYPKARMLAVDRGTLEVSRVGTDGVRNGCSMLYASITRAAKALGFRRLITYTLVEEPGTSLKASGWTVAGTVQGRSWARRQESRGRMGYVDGHDTGDKVRWEIHLGPPLPDLIWPADEAPPVTDPRILRQMRARPVDAPADVDDLFAL